VAPSLLACEQQGLSRLLVGGGVACNRLLRDELTRRAAERGITAVFPTPAYCTDNAVMIAGLGWELLKAGETAGLDLDALAR
jgi:N6-L-threonylcarbamoyladenine synthase